MVQGQRSWKHDFEITGDPKGPTSGSNFWSGLVGPKKSKMANKAQNRYFFQSIDNSLLSSRLLKKCPKNVCPYME